MIPLSPTRKIYSIINEYYTFSFGLRDGFISELKILRIAKILKENPGLVSDDELMATVLNFSKNFKASDIIQFRKEWIKQTSLSLINGIVRLQITPYASDQERQELIRSCPNDLGRYDVETSTLTYSKEALASVNANDFWNFIQHELVETVVILERGQYEGFVLDSLSEKRPDPRCFLEDFKLLFKEGEMIVPKAKLFACGDSIEPSLRGRFKVADCIDYSESSVTMNAFEGILNLLETGKMPSDLSIEEFEIAANYLQFKLPSPKLPEGCLGLELFEANGGKLSDFTPLQFRQWIRAIAGMKKDIPGGVIFGIDPGFSIDQILVHNGKVPYYERDVKIQFGGLEAHPCLFVRAKREFAETIGKYHHEQSKLLDAFSKKVGRTYKPLTIRQAVVFEVLNFIKTGKYSLNDTVNEIHTTTSDKVKFMFSDSAVAILRVSSLQEISIEYSSYNFAGLIPCRTFVSETPL